MICTSIDLNLMIFTSVCSAEVGIDCVFLRATTDNAGPTSKYKGTDSTTRAQNAVQGPTSKYKGTSRSKKVQRVLSTEIN